MSDLIDICVQTRWCLWLRNPPQAGLGAWTFLYTRIVLQVKKTRAGVGAPLRPFELKSSNSTVCVLLDAYDELAEERPALFA